LPRRIGWLKAKEMTYTSEIITAAEAERIGLVNQVVPADKLEKAVKDLAKKIMANSRDSVAANKHLYNEGMRMTMADGLDLENNTPVIISDTMERVAGFTKKGKE
jgi:enoyl-CoA hydratase/carnithine racemase